MKGLFRTIDKDEKINLTDTDVCFQKGKKGNFDLFYNVQVGCNEQQIILYSEVCTDTNDRQQLIPGIKGVEKNTGKKVEKSLADAGYSSFDNMEYMKNNDVTGYVPDQDFGKTFKDKPYHKYHFKEDKENNQLICPQGQILKYHQKKKERTNTFHVYKGIACEACPVKDSCTQSKTARTVRIELREPLKQEMQKRLQTQQGKVMYKKRFHPVEAIFGHLVFNLGYTNFLLRGLEKVKAEFQLMCITYNLMKLFNKNKATFYQNCFLSFWMALLMKRCPYFNSSKNS